MNFDATLVAVFQARGFVMETWTAVNGKMNPSPVLNIRVIPPISCVTTLDVSPGGGDVTLIMIVVITPMNSIVVYCDFFFNIFSNTHESCVFFI